jgi:molecular chaperone IbpA
MTKITSFDLTPFYRNTIGIDRLFDRIVNQIDHNTTQTNYPPYNIVETGENTYEVQVAVAGFSQGELDIVVRDNELIITGEKTETQLDTYVYRHQGISARKFIRTFSLSDYVEVKSATARDGILIVKLERIVPETLKPKKIAIAYENTIQA